MTQPFLPTDFMNASALSPTSRVLGSYFQTPFRKHFAPGALINPIYGPFPLELRFLCNDYGIQARKVLYGKQSTNKLGTSEGTGNQGKDIPKFCFLILSSTSFALIFLQTMAITRLVVKGPTRQLCQSSQVPESGFQVLSPREQGCFPSPVNSSP